MSKKNLGIESDFAVFGAGGDMTPFEKPKIVNRYFEVRLSVQITGGAVCVEEFDI